MTLLELLGDGKAHDLVVSKKMEGQKAALVVGKEVWISSAMFILYADGKATVEERNFVLRNIPCKVLLKSERVNVEAFK